jgi:hypothetical protein
VKSCASARDSRHHRETLPASRVVDFYRVEKDGKRAEILRWVGCQRAQQFGPGEIGTGEIGTGKTLGSLRENGLPM